MLRPRPVRAALRTLAIGGLGLTGVALLAGCGSGGGDGTATLPPGISAGGAVTLPDDVAVTRPPEEEPADAPPAEEPIVKEPIAEEPIAEEPIVEEPIVEPPAEDPGADATADTALDDATTDDDVVWWPWVLGLLVIIVAVAVAVSRSRRVNSAWTTRALAAIDESDALTTHLLAIAPEGLVVVARDDAQRLAELDVTTQDLVRTAPDDRTRGSIDALRGPLVQLHAAMDMVALSLAPTPAQLTVVHQWANALHVATSTARSALTTPSS